MEIPWPKQIIPLPEGFRFEKSILISPKGPIYMPQSLMAIEDVRVIRNIGRHALANLIRGGRMPTSEFRKRAYIMAAHALDASIGSLTVEVPENIEVPFINAPCDVAQAIYKLLSNGPIESAIFDGVLASWGISRRRNKELRADLQLNAIKGPGRNACWLVALTVPQIEYFGEIIRSIPPHVTVPRTSKGLPLTKQQYQRYSANSQTRLNPGNSGLKLPGDQETEATGSISNEPEDSEHATGYETNDSENAGSGYQDVLRQKPKRRPTADHRITDLPEIDRLDLGPAMPLPYLDDDGEIPEERRHPHDYDIQVRASQCPLMSRFLCAMHQCGEGRTFTSILNKLAEWDDTIGKDDVKRLMPLWGITTRKNTVGQNTPDYAMWLSLLICPNLDVSRIQVGAART